MSRFTFTNSRLIDAQSRLAPHQLAQVPVLGVALDGEALPFAERLDAEFYDPALCDVVDEQGAPRFEVWTTSDAGGVFRAGTTELVAPITQGGFAAPNLEVWAALACATPLEGSPASQVSWAVSSEGGPTLHALDPSVTSLSGLKGVRIGEAWPALVVALAPFDRTGTLRAFLLAAGGARRPELKGPYGAAAWFTPSALTELAAWLGEVPPDAMGRVSAPLDELSRYGITPGEGIDLPWLSHQLARFRAFVVETAAAGKGAAVVIL